MPTLNQPKLFGLGASGLIWMAATTAMAQGDPTLPALPSTDAPPAAEASASSTYSVLLLKSGKVISGDISRDATGSNYVLKQHGSSIGYPDTLVAVAGQTNEDLYQYLLKRLAVRDADERMKLAKWCLTNGLPRRAKEQLLAVLELCPGDPEATRMQFSIAANDEKDASTLDRAVSRTNGEMPEANGAPAPLSPGVMKQVRKQGYGRDVFPVIFDLPQSQAVMQAQRFTQQIQPILQNKCAGCHNERYQGAFQLIAVKVKREMTPDVARANLDATLRLVNPDDLARSELLSSGLVPHGPNKAAIFRGPNDVEYQRIAQWVRALRPARPPGTEGVARTGYNGPASGFATVPRDGGDGFASDRSNRSAIPGTPVTPLVPVPPSDGFPPLPGDPIAPMGVKPPGDRPGYLAGDQYNLTKDYSGGLPDSAFPVPYAAGGEAPAAPARPASARPAAPGAAAPDEAKPAAPPTMATQVDAHTVLVKPTDDVRQLPGMNQERYPPKAPTAAGEKKTKKVDPKLLEQIMRQRNANP